MWKTVEFQLYQSIPWINTASTFLIMRWIKKTYWHDLVWLKSDVPPVVVGDL